MKTERICGVSLFWKRLREEIWDVDVPGRHLDQLQERNKWELIFARNALKTIPIFKA